MTTTLSRFRPTNLIDKSEHAGNIPKAVTKGVAAIERLQPDGGVRHVQDEGLEHRAGCKSPVTQNRYCCCQCTMMILCRANTGIWVRLP
jgi:hypothetical protein